VSAKNDKRSRKLLDDIRGDQCRVHGNSLGRNYVLVADDQIVVGAVRGEAPDKTAEAEDRVSRLLAQMIVEYLDKVTE
jgi:hypothetical protein